MASFRISLFSCRTARFAPWSRTWPAQCSLPALAAFVVASAVLLAPAPAAYAQEFRATITGTVVDPSGASIPKAQITVTEQSTGAISKTVSDGAGEYNVPFLLPGDYSIEAQAEGFSTLVQNHVTLQAGDHPAINLKLSLGKSSQTVTISASTPLIDQSNASVGQVISTKDIADLPLNGRTPIMLTELSIGVIDTGTPSQVRAFDNNAANAWSIGGVPNQTSEILIDGVPDTTWSGALAYSPMQDAVQEVSVSVFDTDASFGHTIGGVLNQITKSGTNELHGTAYEFGQISALDANSYFNDRSNVVKPVTHYNQYGLTVGGPVYIPHLFDGRDKVFFFFGWEGLKDSQPLTVFNTVPTAAERTGDFSALLPLGCPSGYKGGDSAVCANGKPNAYQFYNPYTGVANAKGVITRSPIANNVISSLPLSKVAQAYLQYYPLPNVASQNADGYQNYVSNAPSIDTFDNEFGRLDWNMSSRSHLFGDFRHNNRLQTKDVFFPQPVTGTTLLRENFGSNIDEIFTVNPSTVVDLRAGWTYFDEVHGTPASKFTPSSVGLPSALTSTSSYAQLPFIGFSGSCGSYGSFQCLGDTGSSKDPSTEYQVFADVVKTLGRHTLKVGTDLRQYRLDVINYGASSGSFTFGSNFIESGSSGSAPTFAGDFASFLLGLPSSGEYVLPSRASYHQWYTAGFVQDDWRATDHLTLNLGLRFDHDSPYDEKLGRTVSGFNPGAPLQLTAAAQAAYAKSPNAALAAAVFNPSGGLVYPNTANGAPYQTLSHLFSPRFGFSFSPAQLPNTVIRGGFGMFVAPDSVSNLAATGTYSSNAITDQQGFSATTNYVSTNNNYLTPATTLDNPFPSGFEQPTGSSLGANTFLGSNISFLAPRQKDPYSLRWNLGLEHSFGSKFVAELAYIANHAVDLPVAATQLNPVPAQYLSTLPTRDETVISNLSASTANPFSGLLPGSSINGSKISVAQLVSAHPQFPTSGQGFSSGIIEQNNTIGQSYFESVDARIEKRPSHGLTLLATYSFSKLIEADTYLNDTDTFLNRRISPFDHTHHFVTAGTYDLPFGRGKLFNTSSRLVDTLVGGFHLNGIYTFQTGAPIYFASDLVLAPGATFQNITVNNRDTSTQNPALNIAAFNTSSTQQFGFHLRTLPQTFANVRQDGLNNLDSSVLKDTAITSRVTFELRFETFNTLNHPTYSAPAVSSATSSSFGVISSTYNTSRQTQIGGRIIF